MIVYCLIHTISVPDIVLQLWRKLRVKTGKNFSQYRTTMMSLEVLVALTSSWMASHLGFECF